MSTTYHATLSFVIDPPPETMDIRCPFCKEWIAIEVSTSLYATTGCELCGADLTVRAEIIIEGKPQL